MRDIIIFVCTVASGVGGVVALLAYLEMRRASIGGKSQASQAPEPSSESQVSKKPPIVESPATRSYEVRRYQIECAVNDFSSSKGDEAPKYSLHELELLLSWQKTKVGDTLIPQVTDAVLKSIHRKYIERWAVEHPPCIPAQSEEEQGEGNKWELIDSFDAFPEIPSFETIKKNIELRSHARKMLSISVPIIALGIAGLVWANSGNHGIGAGLVTFLVLWLCISMGVGSLQQRVEKALSTPLWNWSEELHPTGENALDNRDTFDPDAIFWHPYIPLILVTKDHLRFNSWKWEFSANADPEKRIERRALHGGQCIFSQGWINHVFFSKYYTLVESEHKWNYQDNFIYHNILIDRYGSVVSHITTSDRGVLFGINSYGSQRRSPFRSGSEGDLLFHRWPHALCLVAVDELPQELKLPKPSFDDIFKSFGKSSLDLTSLMTSENDYINDACWHPSGQYLALNVDGRIYLLHWESGEIVGLLPASGRTKYWMDEWSEDGCLLRVTKRVSREKCVWDMVHDEIREVNEDDKWQRLQSEQGNSRKLISPTRYGRYRNFSGKTIAGKSMSGFKDEAACPYDPSLLATVGGDDHEREVRVWRVVETAD